MSIFASTALSCFILLSQLLGGLQQPPGQDDRQEPGFQLLTDHEVFISPPSYDDPHIIRSRYVKLNEPDREQRLDLEFFRGAAFTAELLRVDEHPNGSRSWVGRLKGQQWGYFILSVTDGVLWGKAMTDEGRQYLIRYREVIDSYEVMEMNAEGLKEEGCGRLLPLPQEGKEEGAIRANTSVCNAGATCPSDTVYMVILYTADARQDLGGTASAQSAIATAVSEMNTMNTNSNVDHTFLLAHAEETGYTESGSIGTDLTRLSIPDDGFIDEAHDIRDQYYGDLVSLVVGYGGCGVGWINSDANAYSAGLGFHVVDDLCLTINLSLAHEAGHNMGLNHDRYVYGGNPPDLPCEWTYGYVNQDAPGGGSSDNWRTVMAYNNQCADWGFNCFRIAYWSNPDETFTGDPVGVPLGDPDEAHAAYLLNRAICVISKFRDPPSCSGCTVYQGCANYDAATSAGQPTAISITGNFDQADSQGPDVQVCVYTHGDNSSPLEVFDLKDENGNVLGQSNFNTEDCDLPTPRACYSVSPSTYNSWISDDEIGFELDPVSNFINPNLCFLNRGCVEVLLPISTPCLPGGTYSGAGANPEPLPSGTYQYQDSVTLSNYIVEDGSTVIIKAELGIRLSASFIVEEGASVETELAPCP